MPAWFGMESFSLAIPGLLVQGEPESTSSHQDFFSKCQSKQNLVRRNSSHRRLGRVLVHLKFSHNPYEMMVAILTPQWVSGRILFIVKSRFKWMQLFFFPLPLPACAVVYQHPYNKDV